jgi:hypothetical protein
MSKNPPKSSRKGPESAKTPEVLTSQHVTAENPPAEIPENDDEIERIGIPIVKKTGLPAWNRMRKPEEAKATLRAIARDPAISGGSNAESAALVPLCAQAVVLLGVVAQASAKRAGYVNPEVLQVSGEEAIPIGQLAMAVLVKYQATMTYAEEWMLGAALIGLFATKAMQLEKPASVPTPVAA